MSPNDTSGQRERSANPMIAAPTTEQQAAIEAVVVLYDAQVADLVALSEAWDRGDLTAIDALTASTTTRWGEVVNAFGALHDLFPGHMAPTAIIKPIVADYYAKLAKTPDVGELAEREGMAA